MPSYGFTPAGPVPQTTAIIREQLQAALRGEYGEAVPLGAKTLLGTLVDLISDRLGSLWDLWLASVAAGDPDGAEDAALEVIAAYQLVLREGPRPSLATLVLTGAPGTIVAASSTVSVPDSSVAFRTLRSVTLIAVASWTAATAVAVGDKRARSGRVYLCAVAGVTGSTGPASTARAPEVDGTAQWVYLGDGVAAADVDAACTLDGPTEAPAHSITVPDPLSGWSSVTNPSDALIGQLRQTDNSLRVTRENALARAGAGTPDAIRADILAVPGVRAVSVFSNRGVVVDGDGVPPGAVEALVTGGDDAAVAAALFASASGSSGLHGSTSVTVVDSEGVEQTVQFSRPTSVPVYVSITVRRDPLRYPSDGDAVVAARVITYGNAQGTGVDLDALALAGQVVPQLVGGLLREQVVGVTGAVSCTVGTAPSPTGLTVPISRRQVADLDSSRIAVSQASP